MNKQKSEKHHWWPNAVSQFWKNQDGCTNWLLPDGSVRTAPPKNFGVIGNGHFIKLNPVPGEQTVWDENFEREFQRADDNFPSVIKWLETLEQVDRTVGFQRGERYVPQEAPIKMLSKIVESIVSLAIRSPMNRQSTVRLVERFRGKVPERERNALIAENMKGCQRRVVDSIGFSAKFAVVISPDREFVFGDGFFHNIRTPVNAPTLPKIFVPLTPRLSVLMVRPMRYETEPRLSTIVITEDEADCFNEIIQIYAKEAIYFRSECPKFSESFAAGTHMQFDRSTQNPIEDMIENLPGVSKRYDLFTPYPPIPVHIPNNR